MQGRVGLGMTKLLSLFVVGCGLALGVGLFLSWPSVSSVEAREERPMECRTEMVKLDEGYSISRVEPRTVCRPVG